MLSIRAPYPFCSLSVVFVVVRLSFYHWDFFPFCASRSPSALCSCIDWRTALPYYCQHTHTHTPRHTWRRDKWSPACYYLAKRSMQSKRRNMQWEGKKKRKQPFILKSASTKKKDALKLKALIKKKNECLSSATWEVRTPTFIYERTEKEQTRLSKKK